jgi:Ca2+-binding RTX toxin-like protein
MILPRTSSVVVALLAGTALSAVPADAATTAKVVFKNGRLVVVGSDAGETIVVSRSGSIVRVKIGSKFVTPRPKPTARLTKAIVVRASGGDDTVLVDSSGGTLPRATIKGGDGNDTLRGSAASDIVRGGPGNDLLHQGGGDDTLSGEQGDDVYRLDADGADALVRLVESASGGTDTVDLSATTTLGMEVALDLVTQLVTPTFGLALSTPGNFENLTGGALGDNLRGGPGDSLVRGGAGNDTLLNSAGADVLDGGPGDSEYAIDGDLAGTVSVVETGGPEHDLISTWPTTTVDPTLDAGTTASQAVSPSLQLQLSSGAAFDSLLGGPRDDTLTGNGLMNVLDGASGDDDLRGGDGVDALVSGPGENTLRGGTGDDLYALDGDETSVEHLVENSAEGTDTLVFSDTTGSSVDVDLSDTGTQAVTTALDIQLNVDDTFEDIDGTPQDDTLAGGGADNSLEGGAGKDTYVHHGSGDGIDTIVGGLDTALDEQVLFDTAGSVSAADLTLNAGANQVRDAATGTFGYNSTGLIDGTAFYIFGTTDTAPAGQLITFNGAGGFGLGSNVDSLIASYASSGVTIGGAGGKDRIIDYSANGNSLVGRDGLDVLVGGDGADTLQGDRGFAPGVADILTGGADGDTFRMGEAFGGATAETFGAEVVTDFGSGDTVDLYTTLSVRSGLGTSTVTIWDGATDFGTVTASNGHLWVAGDFT